MKEAKVKPVIARTDIVAAEGKRRMLRVVTMPKLSLPPRRARVRSV